MSNRFEKLYSLPSPLYAPSMPVIIVAGALLKDTQTGKVLAQLKFKNVNSKVIKAVTVSLLPRDTADQPLGEKETHQILDLTANRDDEFGQKTPLYFSNNTTRAYQVVVEEVVFSDNAVWKSDNTPLSDLPAQKTAADMFSDDELEKQYKLEYGERATYIADTCSDLWRCNCGAINQSDEQNCHGCGSEKDTVLSFDTNQLKSNCNARIEQAEKAALEARIALKKRSKKACVAIAIVIVALLIIAGLTWAYTTVISPSIGYKRATSAYSAGDYPTAISEYTKLNGFKDSQEMLQKVFAAYADELFDEGEYQTAVNCYRKLAERNIEREQECHYHLMINAIAEHDWNNAEIQYGYIKGYSDADERSADITIGKAEKLIEEKDYLAANELLSICPSENEKVTALKKDVQYLIAVSYYEGSNGQKRDYAKAADGFSVLVNDEEYGADAKEYLYQCALKLYDSSTTKQIAITYFERIETYKDAKSYIKPPVSTDNSSISGITNHKDNVSSPTDRNTIPVERVEISEKRIQMVQGTSRQLVATVYPENATNKKLKWYVAGGRAAKLTEDGYLTLEGNYLSETKIYAEASNGVRAECIAEVIKPTAFINVNGARRGSTNSQDDERISLTPGDTINFSIEFTDEYQGDKNVIWETWYDTDLFSVNISGTSGSITALARGSYDSLIKHYGKLCLVAELSNGCLIDWVTLFII